MNHVISQLPPQTLPGISARQSTPESDEDARPGGRASVLSPRLTRIIALLATSALLSSSYLSWVGLTSSNVVGCDGGVFDCGHVLTSRWSSVLGVPVGVPAVFVYTSMLAAVACTRSSSERIHKAAVQAVWLLSILAALAAIWFITLQVTFIGRLCPYCLLVHACGVVLAALMIWYVPMKRASTVRLSAVAVALVVSLMITQLASSQPQTYVIEDHPAKETLVPSIGGGEDVFEAPELFEVPVEEYAAPPNEHQSSFNSPPAHQLSWMMPAVSLIGVLTAPQGTTTPLKSNNADKAKQARRLVPVMGGSNTLDADQWPLWGKADAEHMVVEMFDYTCSHCRNTHQAIREASNQLNGNFAVIALPVPLHRDCNDAATSSSPERAHACELARIAVAVWLADRRKFTAFHDWLFEQERSVAEARAYAEKAVGSEALKRQLTRPAATNYISRNVELYKQAGRGAVPKIIFPTKTIVGEITSGSTVVDLLLQKSAKEN